MHKSEQFCLITFRFASWNCTISLFCTRYFISYCCCMTHTMFAQRWYQNVFLSLFRLSLSYTESSSCTELIELLSPFKLYRLQRKLNKCLLCCFWRILLKKLTRESRRGMSEEFFIGKPNWMISQWAKYFWSWAVQKILNENFIREVLKWLTESCQHLKHLSMYTHKAKLSNASLDFPEFFASYSRIFFSILSTGNIMQDKIEEIKRKERNNGINSSISTDDFIRQISNMGYETAR